MFETHKVNDRGFEQIATFKTTMSDAVKKVLLLIPEGRERSLFITKLEEAIFYGTKAIASKENNFTEIVRF